MLHIKDNIKKIRKLKGITQPEFATLMGVTLGMQKSYEGGKSKPDIVYLEKLSEESGFPIEALKGTAIPHSKMVTKATNGKFEEPELGYKAVYEQSVHLSLTALMQGQEWMRRILTETRDDVKAIRLAVVPDPELLAAHEHDKQTAQKLKDQQKGKQTGKAGGNRNEFS